MAGLNLKKIGAWLGGRTPDVGSGDAVGAAADTNITLTGIRLGDQILFAFQVPPQNDTGTNPITDRSAVCKVTAANTIQFTGTATNSPANSKVFVVYLKTGRR